jgi:polysaccharide export outer membrane protein
MALSLFQFDWTIWARNALIFIVLAIPLAPGGLIWAQGLPAGPGNPPIPPGTTQELNQRLQQSNKRLTATLPEADESRIGPDDLLEITVFEAPEMNAALRVSANGEISLQLVGPVKAAGLTPRELELVLQELLRRTYMKDPHVGVFVQELQSHSVSVVGAVKNPGVFQIRDSKTVIELLSMAQGLTDDAGDTVWIMRGAGLTGYGNHQSQNFTTEMNGAPATPNSELNTGTRAVGNGQDAVVKVNLKDLLESADPTLNVAVYPGDIVKVTRAGIVYVVGEVNKPGGFVLTNNENISVLQALALAQGLTRTSAKGEARIIRTAQNSGKRIEIPLDLGKILANKAPDLSLGPKDILFVPNSAVKSALYRGTETVLYSAAGAAIYRW